MEEKETLKKNNLFQEEEITEEKLQDQELEKELFSEIFENEKELHESAQRLLQQGEETLKLADGCNQLLREQDEEMNIMIENLNIIESNTVKAKKEMIGIFKKLFAEKLIVILIIGLIFIICGIVLFKVLDLVGVWKAISNAISKK
jgi:hypothetical protein